LASTNTSWIFFDLPASRSPARQARTLRPGSFEAMRHSPQRTSPSSETGVVSSQTRSYSRTAVRPAPRSSRRDPAVDASNSSSAEGSPAASRSRLRSAAGCSSRRRGRISFLISPRFVSLLDSSFRNSSPSTRQYSSVSARQTVRSGRTTPSSRRGLIPFATPLATSRYRTVSTWSEAVCPVARR
jgi:hypothetical protein